MTEAQFLKAVIELAHRLGWKCAHFPSVQNAGGRWMTPKQADSKGFPDLVLARGERLIFAELKSENGRMSPEQDAWMDALRFTGATLAVWMPHHWPIIEQELRETRTSEQIYEERFAS